MNTDKVRLTSLEDLIDSHLVVGLVSGLLFFM
jgi:hypothetical protein